MSQSSDEAVTAAVERIAAKTIKLGSMTLGDALELEAAEAVCIRSNNGWWRANGQGYTNSLQTAAIYAGKDAYRWTSHCGPEKEVSYAILAANPTCPPEPVIAEALASADLSARIIAENGAKGLHRDAVLIVPLAAAYRAQSEALVAAQAEKEWAKEATRVITNLTPGGSEYFTRHGDEYRADLVTCEKAVRERFEKGHAAMCEAAKLRKERDAAQAEASALREALTPFAIEGKRWAPIHSDDFVPDMDTGHACDECGHCNKARYLASFTVGDLRRAAALSEPKL